MHFLTILFLAATASATPMVSDATRMRAELQQSDACSMPNPGSNCAGATMKDIIVEFPKNVKTSDSSMMIGVVNQSGGKLIYDWKKSGNKTITEFQGFAAYVPNEVVDLMKAHGATIGISVHDNGCAGIPWCGDSPC